MQTITRVEDTTKEELWASRNLDLIWLPTAIFAAPCMQSVVVPDRTSSDLLRWFWPVDRTFGIWLARCLYKVRAEAITIPIHEQRSARVIRAYLDELQPGTWDACLRLATVGPISLPASVIHETLDLIRFGVFPAWDGWEKLHAKVYGSGDSLPAPASVDDSQPVPRPRKTRSGRPRPGATTEMF